MELWQFCFLVIGFIEFWIRSYNGLVTSDNYLHCNNYTPIQPFPVRRIPVKWHFRLILQTTGRDRPFKEKLCLEESQTLMLRLCNVNSSKQLWFQTNGSLINIESGQFVVPQNFIAGSSLVSGSLTPDEYSWICQNNGNQIALGVRRRSNGELFISEGTSRRNQVVLTNQPNSFWILADKDGVKLNNSSALCKQKVPYCGFPFIGSNSYILTMSNIYSFSGQVSKSVLQQVISNDLKLCYQAGISVHYACTFGYISVGTENKTHLEALCLGDGIWSHEPLHCIRRNCGTVPDIPNAIVRDTDTHRYGAEVSFTCLPGFSSMKNHDHLLCSGDGTWIGVEYTCLGICNKTLYENHGFINSPNYPRPYPVDIQCSWRIRAAKGLRVAFWFRDFFLEEGSIVYPYCRSDFLFFRDFTQTSTKSSQLFCGSFFPRVWYSTANSVDVEFISDPSFNTKGFKLEYLFWNDSVSLQPVEPYFNYSNPDILDETFVYLSAEKTRYILEGCYSISVAVLLLCILIVVIKHAYERYVSKIEPLIIDPEAIMARRKSSVIRRNAISQCTDSNINESIAKSTSIMMISDTSLMKNRTMNMVAGEIEAFWELSGDIHPANQTRFVAITMNDITPPTVVSETNLSKHFADINCEHDLDKERLPGLLQAAKTGSIQSLKIKKLPPVPSPVEIVLTSAEEGNSTSTRRSSMVPTYERRLSQKFKFDS